MSRAKLVRTVFLTVALIQTAIFGYCAFSSHAYSVANSKRRADSFEYFYCLELKRSYPAVEEQGFGIYGECRPPLRARYVFLTNLPVFLVTYPTALFVGTKLRTSQVILFYALTSILIPLFWYGMGVIAAKRFAATKQKGAAPAEVAE